VVNHPARISRPGRQGAHQNDQGKSITTVVQNNPTGAYESVDSADRPTSMRLRAAGLAVLRPEPKSLRLRELTRALTSAELMLAVKRERGDRPEVR
jgi:hypothetical protein